jgi:hypothetical protein
VGLKAWNRCYGEGLPITAPLHRFQNGFEIAPNQPYPRVRRFRQTHLLKHKQPGVNVLFPRLA